MGEMTAAEMGAFIAKTRKAQNMTQSALAQRLNVTSQAVSRWERGLGFPDIGTLLPLADALGIGIDELINTKRKDDDQFFVVTAVGSIQKTICIAIEQINGSKWRKMLRLEILLCVIGICVLLYTALGDYAVWRLIRIYNEAFRLSCEMMDGNKWHAFCLDLSFIGWHILNVFTFGLLGIFYVKPYEATASAEMYIAIRDHFMGRTDEGASNTTF